MKKIRQPTPIDTILSEGVRTNPWFLVCKLLKSAPYAFSLVLLFSSACCAISNGSDQVNQPGNMVVENKSSEKGDDKITEESKKIWVIPSGTKIPVVLEDLIHSVHSKNGDEFTARTIEDLNIDGGLSLPANCQIGGKIVFLKALNPSNLTKEMVLSFDTMSDSNNHVFPISANVVAHGGVIHAKRGLQDIAVQTKPTVIPFVSGMGISYQGVQKATKARPAPRPAQFDESELPRGATILLITKTQKIDLRPGDEIKIELSEDLKIPRSE